MLKLPVGYRSGEGVLPGQVGCWLVVGGRPGDWVWFVRLTRIRGDDFVVTAPGWRWTRSRNSLPAPRTGDGSQPRGLSGAAASHAACCENGPARRRERGSSGPIAEGP